MQINFKEIPYNHAGRWEKKIDSIMNPGSKISWVQFITEMVIFNRTKYIKNFQSIKRGPGWSSAISKQVRQLVQQSAAICNFFPHPDDEPLVYVAFKNYFRNNRVMKIGQFRKSRVTKTGKLNVTNDEMDIIKGVWYELERLIDQRDMFKNVVRAIEDNPTNENITFRTVVKSNNKKNLSSILELEKNMNRKSE